MEKSWATPEISQVQIVYPKCRCIRPALKVISIIGEILGDTGTSRLSEVLLYSPSINYKDCILERIYKKGLLMRTF